MFATTNSWSAKCAALLSIGGSLTVCFLWLAFPCAGESGTAANEPPFARAERLAREARVKLEQEPKNVELAWQYARACFDAAEFAPTGAIRAEYATKGIDAARAAVRLAPKSAPAHYYLGMNIGQLARTKMLGALKLVDDMEAAFYAVVRLDARFDFAGAHRCLGLLYRDAPGWPISVGNRSKARQHLTKAVELAPEYPDNWLCLIEANLGWGEKDRARKNLESASEHLQSARKRLTGVQWQSSWQDWNNRLNTIRSKLQVEKIESPKGEQK